GLEAKPRTVRTLAVGGSLLLAGTDVGLFRSTDAGATFALVDLPNALSGKPLLDSVWSIVKSGDHWVLSDVRACDFNATSVPFGFSSQDPNPGCIAGNDAEIWTSADGQTWTAATMPQTTNTGRVTLAANGATVYAFVGNVTNLATLGFW